MLTSRRTPEIERSGLKSFSFFWFFNICFLNFFTFPIESLLVFSNASTAKDHRRFTVKSSYLHLKNPKYNPKLVFLVENEIETDARIGASSGFYIGKNSSSSFNFLADTWVFSEDAFFSVVGRRFGLESSCAREIRVRLLMIPRWSSANTKELRLRVGSLLL